MVLSVITRCALVVILLDAENSVHIMRGRGVIPLALIEDKGFEHYEPILGMSQAYLKALVREVLKEVSTKEVITCTY